MLELITSQALTTAVEIIVGAVVGGLVAMVGTRWKERKTLEQKLELLTAAIENNREQLMKEIAGLKEAESANLRNTIRHSCKNGIRDRWISLDEKQDILACYEAYERIVSNNGVIDDIVIQMRELPNEKPLD